MNSEERAHTQRLLETHRARMHELELKAAKYGELEVPTHISLELRDLRARVDEVEVKLRAALPQHNLPPRDYERFVGRSAELAELRRLLGPRSRAFVVTVDGIGGIGKSALALESAYAFVDGYATLPEKERFEAIVWVSAKRSYLTATGILERHQAFRTLDDLFTAIAHALDYPAITRARADERRAIVEQVLGEQRTLMVIDNLETVDDEDLLVFLRELPDPTKAIVTTRHRIDVAYPVRLSSMPHADAIALIAQEAERKGVTLSADDQESLWQRTGGMPLALVWSIGLMGLGGSVESVLLRLGSGQSDIAKFCFDESVAQIKGRDAYHLLLALSLFATDASRDALGAVANLGDDAFGRDIGLEALLRLSLVNKEGERFSLLPLTRSFVQREASTNEAWMQNARIRWVEYFDNFIENYSGWSDDWRGHDLVELDIYNIFAVFDYLVATIVYEGTNDRKQAIAKQSFPQAIMLLRIADRVSRTLRFRGYWQECERIVQIALSISKAIGEDTFTGWLSYSIARIYYYRNNIGAARIWIADMLSVAKKQDNDSMSSRAYLMLGMLELQQNDSEQARLQFDIGLEKARSARSTSGVSNILAAIGDVAMYSGDTSTAASYYHQAIGIAQQVNDVPKQASHLLHLGIVSRSTSNLAAAKNEIEESLRLARECRWISVIAEALYNLALVEREQLDLEDARSHINQALDLFRRLGMKREQAEAESLLATIADSEQPPE